MEIKEALRQIIDENKLTRKEFASKIGVGEVALYQWLSGKKTPRLQNYRKIEEIFPLFRKLMK